MWTKKQRCSSQNSAKSGVKTQKKGVHLKKCANFDDFWGEIIKTKRFYCKIYQRTVLAYEFWGDIQYFGSLRLELHSSSKQLLNFFGAQSSLGWHNFFGGAQAVIWGARPQNAPRGAGLALESMGRQYECYFVSWFKRVLKRVLNYTGSLPVGLTWFYIEYVTQFCQLKTNI